MDALMLHEDASGLLFRCDSLWGDDAELFNLLNCDLALDEELPNLLDEGAPHPALPLRSAASVPPTPQAEASPTGCMGSAILLPAAVCKGPPARRSHSPAFSGSCRVLSLPALQGCAHSGGAGQWRTVTTTATLGDICQNRASSQCMFPALDQSYMDLDIVPMPSSDTTGSDSTRSQPVGMTSGRAPAANDGSVPASRPRRNTACCKADSSKQPLDTDAGDDDDTDSEDSNDTEERVAACHGVMDSQGQTARPNKRKAPEIDWRCIDDPAERRRQRRLAKNRVTAARSRERKKSQWAEMEEKLSGMEAENRSLREMLESMSKDNQALRAQLTAALGVQGGAAAAGSTAAAAAKGGKHTEPAVLVLIATLLLLCAFLPNSSNSNHDQQQQVLGPAMLGAAILLVDMLRQLNTRRGSRSLSSGPVAFFETSQACKSGHDSDKDSISMMAQADGLSGGTQLQSRPCAAPVPTGSNELQSAPACSLSFLWQAIGAVLTCLLAAVGGMCGTSGPKSKLLLPQHTVDMQWMTAQCLRFLPKGPLMSH